jgi:signal peptidase I
MQSVALIFMSILLPMTLIVLARSLFFLVEVNGWSMYPTLHDGDLLLAFRFWSHWKLRKGQIVVWEPPAGISSLHYPSEGGNSASLYIKRVIGLAEETVVIPAEFSDFPETVEKGTDKQNHVSWCIPAGHCFVKGDSPGLDSTRLGPLPLDCVRGIILIKIWHRYLSSSKTVTR